MQEISSNENPRLKDRTKHVGGPITGKYIPKRDFDRPDYKRDTDVVRVIEEARGDL